MHNIECECSTSASRLDAINDNALSYMTKSNTADNRQQTPTYYKHISPQIMDGLQEKIFNILYLQKKYRDKAYTAKHLAADLQTNTRYVSAVLRVRFDNNFTGLVNKYRVGDAISLLSDNRHGHLNIEDVSDMVGFANRQSFYAAFTKETGTTPKAFRMKYMADMPKEKKKKSRKRTAVGKRSTTKQ